MPRPRSYRKISFQPSVTYFKPQGVPLRDLEVETISLEELEALRLKDLEGYEQIECARKMQTSQSTFQRILWGARRKITRAFIEGKAIEVEMSEE